jgi:hypothetical protein
MSQDKAIYLFIKYQSLYVKYSEKADNYRKAVGREVQVYSDLLARLALSKANYYEGIAQGRML